MIGNMMEHVVDSKIVVGTARATSLLAYAHPDPKRIIRGGSYAHAPLPNRAAYRILLDKASPQASVGFRVCRTLP